MLFCLAEYRLTDKFKFWELFLPTIITYLNIIVLAYNEFIGFKFLKDRSFIGQSKKVFFYTFCLILIIDLLHLFLSSYPGILSPDSIGQVNQILSWHFDNHHPFYHTILMAAFIRPGLYFFGNINAAIALYSTFQCFIMSAIFAFVVMTLHEMKVSSKVYIGTALLYALLPYHWMYSCTLWKNIIFSGMAVLIIVSYYRWKVGIGKRALNIGLFAISSLMMILLQSNGIYAYALFTLFLIVKSIWHTADRKSSTIAVFAILLALILQGPVLSSIGVGKDTFSSAISIPLQQMARVVVDHKDLGEKDRILIGRYMDVNLVSKEYKGFISDPIKALEEKKEYANRNNDQYKKNLIKDWLVLGFKYPKSYLKAWVDQTKGYWNGSYPYWVAYHGVKPNQLGIQAQPLSHRLDRINEKIIFNLYHGNIGNLITATGLFNIGLLLLFLFNIIKYRRFLIEYILIFSIVISLLASTPVFNEFRYIYSLYTSLPFLIVIGLMKGENEDE